MPRRTFRGPRRDPARRGRSTYVRSHHPPLLVNGYLAQITYPPSGTTDRSRRPDVTVVATSELGTPCDVEVEWRTQAPRWSDGSDGSPAPAGWYPAPTYTQTFTGQASGMPFVVEPPADLDYTTWYVRVRAGATDAGTWSAWTAADYRLNLTPTLGSVAGYIEMNVGVVTPAQTGAVAYLDMNVGAQAADPLETATVYSDMNVGVRPSWRLVASYADMNVSPVLVPGPGATYLDMDVMTGRPTPHIWWIRPEQGREGYVFHIYGHGFGDFQNEYDGKVLLGDMICPVIRWEKVPAQDPPDAIVRADDPENDVLKPEHGWVTVVVPDGASSGLVKVILEGGA